MSTLLHTRNFVALAKTTLTAPPPLTVRQWRPAHHSPVSYSLRCFHWHHVVTEDKYLRCRSPSLQLSDCIFRSLVQWRPRRTLRSRRRTILRHESIQVLEVEDQIPANTQVQHWTKPEETPCTRTEAFLTRDRARFGVDLAHNSRSLIRSI